MTHESNHQPELIAATSHRTASLQQIGGKRSVMVGIGVHENNRTEIILLRSLSAIARIEHDVSEMSDEQVNGELQLLSSHCCKVVENKIL